MSNSEEAIAVIRALLLPMYGDDRAEALRNCGFCLHCGRDEGIGLDKKDDCQCSNDG